MQTRARNRNFLIFLFISTFAVHQLAARIPLGQLKGSYSIVKEGYERISPLNGAILWYSGNIKNIHTLDKSHHLYPLVASLFHYVPGQFTITQNSKYPAYYLDATSVARIILKIEEFIAANIKILTKNQTNELRVLIEKEIKSKNMGMPLPKNIDTLVKSMEIAFNQSGYFDDKPNLFKYGLHTMFLAFLYEKGESANDLQKYFDEFNENYLNKKFTITEPYKIDDIPAIEKEFLQSNKSLALPGEVFEKYIYAYLINTHFLLPFVEATGYKNANYKVGPLPWTFPDCMETTIRDLCNNVVRNLKTLAFDPKEQIAARKLNWFIDKALENFYATYSDLGTTGVPAAHDDWATNVVSNKEFITYKRINDLNKPTARGIEAPKRIQGFVIVKNLKKQIEVKKPIKYKGYEFIELTIAGRKYYLFDPKELPNLRAYEVNPSVRNLITICNHLFGLNIFAKTKPQETWLEKTLLKTDFNSTYIESMFEKIGLRNTEIKKESIDVNDLTQEKITLIVKKDKSRMKLTLYDTHGYADVTNEPIENKFDLTNELANVFIHEPTSITFKNSLLLTLNKPAYKPIIDFALYNKMPLQHLLLNLDLSSESEKMKTIETIFYGTNEEIIDKLSVSKEESTKKVIPIIKQFWVNLVKSIPLVDGESQKKLSISLYDNKHVTDILLSSKDEDFKNESFLAFFFGCFRNKISLYGKVKVTWNNSIKQAIEAAIKRPHKAYLQSINILFEKFLKEQNSEATKIAEEIIKTKLHKKVSMEALGLSIVMYKNLIQNVYSQIPSEKIKEKELLVKKFDDNSRKIESFIKNKKNVYEEISFHLLKLFKAAIENSLTKNKKVAYRIFQLTKTYLDISEYFPKELIALTTDLFQNKMINENDFFLMMDKIAGKSVWNDPTILKSVRILLEKNTITKLNKILDLTEKIISADPNNYTVNLELRSLANTLKEKKLITLDNIAQMYKSILFKTLVIFDPFKEESLYKAASALNSLYELKAKLLLFEDRLQYEQPSDINRKKMFDQLTKKRIEELQALINKKRFPKEVRQLTEQFFEHSKEEQWKYEETTKLLEKLAQMLSHSFK